ncbi:hypothetical protein Busp01_48800 [Trinickia caryophylli]|nr:hypothetical protein Busp01_48800 [Trinickia caryophylli]
MTRVGQQRERPGKQPADYFHDHEGRDDGKGPADAPLIRYTVQRVVRRMVVPPVGALAAMAVAGMRVAMVMIMGMGMTMLVVVIVLHGQVR